MGIDIYARSPKWSEEEYEAHASRCHFERGRLGYLREAYHGEPHPVHYLLSELFETGSMFEAPEPVYLPAEMLRERLPETFRLSEIRARTIYGVTDKQAIAEAAKEYSDFVDFCAAIEAKTGEPAEINGWW